MLRPVLTEDLPAFFQHQRDPDAARLAVSVAPDEVGEIVFQLAGPGRADRPG